MTSIILIFIVLVYAILIASIYNIDAKKNADKFSAAKVVSYFAWIEVFAMAWFAINPESVEKYIYSDISSNFATDENLIFAYFLSLSAYVFFNLGLLQQKFSIFGFSTIGKTLRTRNFASGKFAWLMWLSGMVIWLSFLQTIGGLSNLWGNLSMRTTLTAGLGYFQAAYTFLLMASTIFLYPKLIARRRYLLLAIVVLGSSLALISLGQRSPLAMLIFCLVLTHNYKISPIKQIISLKYFILVFSLLAFMLVFVQYRGEASSVNSSSRIERDVIQRFGTIERQLVVIGYFSEHPYWGFGAYQSLLSAPIPRSLYPEKPPADTGVYINNIRHGKLVSPPEPVANLEVSSWPDGFLAGYVSFGYLGLAFLAYISGVFMRAIYQWLRKNPNDMGAILIYSSLIYFGAKPLSPFNIVSTLTFFIFLFLLKTTSRLLKFSRII